MVDARQMRSHGVTTSIGGCHQSMRIRIGSRFYVSIGLDSVYCGLDTYFLADDRIILYLSCAGHHDSGNHALSAAGAGLVTVVTTNPLWVVKTRLQTQDMGLRVSWPKYNGTFSAISHIASQEGVAALYSGLVPSIFGIVHVTVQFPLYEYCKAQLALKANKKVEDLEILDLIVASSAAKMVASTLTYPHEVVRSRMHIKGTGPFGGLMDTCRSVYLESGAKGFYKGCTVNLLRTVPAAAVTFTSFELIARYLRKVLLAKE